MSTNRDDTVSTTTEAAEELGVSRVTIMRLLTRGLLTGYKLTPKRNSPYRITNASIKRYKEIYRPNIT